MMMTAVNPGEKIAVPRNSHKSMLGGLVMSGAQPIYMQPAVDQEMHMDNCVTPETVARTLEEHPDLKAVYLVSPTYYGVAADLVVDRAHRARRGQAAARRRGVGPALSLSSGASDLSDGGRRRHVHQLDAQDALGVFAMRDAASNRRSRSARPAEGRPQNVPIDVAEFADGRVARRRAQADGHRRRGAAFANDRARGRSSPSSERRSKASTALAKSCKDAKASSIWIPTKVTVRVTGLGLHRL